MSKLCVNIDHVATLREARKGARPDTLEAADVCLRVGAAGITIHLREDRRHIQDRDLEQIRAKVTTLLNLEMAATQEMVRIALERRPDQVTLVPEKREEVTTEGGLDVAGQEPVIAEATARLQDAGIPVSLFINPDPRQIEATARTGAQLIELHTGRYANATEEAERAEELRILAEEAAHAQSVGLRVNAGHGLDYENVVPVAAIEGMNELNIGHAIIARALFSGLEQAVIDMLALVAEGTRQAPLRIS